MLKSLLMYTPDKTILEKYADVLVNFALGSGKGVKKGEVVFLQVPECAKPLLIALRRAVIKAGAYHIIEYLPDNISKEFFELANPDQIKFFPAIYLKGKVSQMDHVVGIVADTNKYELKGIDPAKIIARSVSVKPYFDWRTKKENEGKMTWTIGMYATPAMAKDANMNLEEYWQQIIKGCFLDLPDPIKKWKEVTAEIERVREKLNDLETRELRIEAKDTDLTIGIDKNRKWLGGSGRNIPSFEIFISPVAVKTEGYICFNQPLYRYGNVIKDIKLEFKNGKVVKSQASQGEKLLQEMIKTKGADMVGEFSLTNSRFSRITKFMGETLFDENLGGKYGNTHIALGSAYKDSYIGDPAKVTKREWRQMGFNESAIHTDIISTTNRKVTATQGNGKKVLIYKEGKFTL